MPCCINSFGKGRSCTEYLHLLVKPIVENKGVGDTESVGFHRVQLAIVEVSNLLKVKSLREHENKLIKVTHIWVVEVGHLRP